jgi:hypothetical protein
VQWYRAGADRGTAIAAWAPAPATAAARERGAGGDDRAGPGATNAGQPGRGHAEHGAGRGSPRTWMWSAVVLLPALPARSIAARVSPRSMSGRVQERAVRRRQGYWVAASVKSRFAQIRLAGT